MFLTESPISDNNYLFCSTNTVFTLAISLLEIEHLKPFKAVESRNVAI